MQRISWYNGLLSLELPSLSCLTDLTSDRRCDPWRPYHHYRSTFSLNCCSISNTMSSWTGWTSSSGNLIISYTTYLWVNWFTSPRRPCASRRIWNEFFCRELLVWLSYRCHRTKRSSLPTAHSQTRQNQIGARCCLVFRIIWINPRESTNVIALLFHRKKIKELEIREKKTSSTNNDTKLKLLITFAAMPKVPRTWPSRRRSGNVRVQTWNWYR